jgi:hypothetical protein
MTRTRLVSLSLSLESPFRRRILRKDRMKLYQHSVRCPAAMQLFLDAHPQYWRFVPMSIDESERECERVLQRPVFSAELDWNQRPVNECLAYVESVPKPHAGLVFSHRQILLQTQFFHNKRDLDLPPHPDVDLYEATLATVRQ